MADVSAEFQRLAPYVLGRARGVVGSSRYAQRLRTAVLDAARDADRRPVLISGEPGLEKDNLAALIHFGSGERRRLLLRLDPADLQGSGRHLLDHLGENSLLVSGIDRVDTSLQQRLIALARGQELGFQGRMLFTSESPVPCLDGITIPIKVPPLRVRRSDLGDWLRYQVRLQSTSLGWGCVPQLPDSVVRRLQNHDFPNNIRELENLVNRALRQAHQDGVGEQTNTAAPPTVLPEAVFGPISGSGGFALTSGAGNRNCANGCVLPRSGTVCCSALSAGCSWQPIWRYGWALRTALRILF